MSEQNNKVASAIPSIKKIYLLVVLLCALGFSLNLFFSLQNNKALYDLEISALETEVRQSFNQSQDSLNKQFQMVTSHYTQMPAITEAIAAKERDTLLQLAEKDYQTLQRQQPHLYVMHYFDTENVTILRVHKPHSFGDDLTALRPMLSHVNSSKKQVSGFEVGRNGITYRVTTPVFDQQQRHIGVLEFGIKPQFFVDELSKRFAIQSTILVKSASLKNLSYATDFRQVSDFSIILGDELYQRLSLEPQRSSQIIEHAESTYLVISDIGLNSFDGKEVVKFQIVKDITEVYEKREYQMWLHIVMNFALFSLFIFILYIIFNGYHQRLIHALYQLKVSQRKQRIITDASHKDELTHAYNRRFFNEVMAELVSAGELTDHFDSIVFFDLDHFKKINDDYGHLVGDEVLKALATFVSSHFRADDLLFRWGGEEFCLLLKNTSLEFALEKAERLRKQVESRVWPENIPLTISIGVTEIRAEDTLEQLQARVDKLLYQAKQGGRNRTIAE